MTETATPVPSPVPSGNAAASAQIEVEQHDVGRYSFHRGEHRILEDLLQRTTFHPRGPQAPNRRSVSAADELA